MNANREEGDKLNYKERIAYSFYRLGKKANTVLTAVRKLIERFPERINSIRNKTRILLGRIRKEVDSILTAVRKMIERFPERINSIRNKTRILLGRIRKEADSILTAVRKMIERFSERINSIRTKTRILLGRIRKEVDSILTAVRKMIERFPELVNSIRNKTHILWGRVRKEVDMILIAARKSMEQFLERVSLIRSKSCRLFARLGKRLNAILKEVQKRIGAFSVNVRLKRNIEPRKLFYNFVKQFNAILVTLPVLRKTFSEPAKVECNNSTRERLAPMNSNRIPRVGIMGGFQYGKSTFINCLLQNRVAISGNGIATTKQVTRFFYAEKNVVNVFTTKGNSSFVSRFLRKIFSFQEREITREYLENIAKSKDVQFYELGIPCDILKYVELWDTPGFNANDRDNEVTESFLEKLDYVFVVVTGALTQSDIETLRMVSNCKIPYTVLFNSKGDNSWEPNVGDNELIRNNCMAQMKQLGFESSMLIPGQSSVLSINTAWCWYDIVGIQKKENLLLSVLEGEEMLFRRVRNYLALQGEDETLNLGKSSNIDVIRRFLKPNGITFGNLHTQLAIYNEIVTLQKSFEEFAE